MEQMCVAVEDGFDADVTSLRCRSVFESIGEACDEPAVGLWAGIVPACETHMESGCYPLCDGCHGKVAALREALGAVEGRCETCEQEAAGDTSASDLPDRKG